MKYYSDITGAIYDTEDELRKDEKEIAEKEAARKEKEVELDKAFERVVELYNTTIKACDEYLELSKELNGKASKTDEFTFDKLMRLFFE